MFMHSYLKKKKKNITHNLEYYRIKYIRGAYDKFPAFFSYGHFYW